MGNAKLHTLRSIWWAIWKTLVSLLIEVAITQSHDHLIAKPRFSCVGECLLLIDIFALGTCT